MGKLIHSGDNLWISRARGACEPPSAFWACDSRVSGVAKRRADVWERVSSVLDRVIPDIPPVLRTVAKNGPFLTT